MIELRSLFVRLKGSRVFSNFFSLSVLQGMNYLLPLITMPYLVRVLGIECFGLVSFISAFVLYFQTLTDYGFNLSATRAIAISRGDTDKLNEIFNATFFLKLVLVILSLVILCCCLLVSETLMNNWHLCLLSLGAVLFQSILPVWYFLGIEQMKFITYLNVLSKIIFTIAIFIFIKAESDYLLIPMFSLIGSLIAVIGALFIIFRDSSIKFRIPRVEVCIVHLKDGWYIFISNLATNLYTVTTTVILGFLTNNVLVGYYAVADKLVFAMKSINNPISQALYPYVARNAVSSKEATLKLLKNLTIFLGLSMFTASLLSIFYAKTLMTAIFGESAISSVIIFQLLAFVPMLVSIDTVFGTLTMIAFNRSKEFTRIILSAGLLNLFLSLLLINLFHHIGAALSVLLVEIYICVRLVVFVQSTDLKIFKA